MAKVHFLNVGHGDCTIIEHNDGKLTMIDINSGDDIDERSARAILDQLAARSPIEFIERSLRLQLGGESRIAVLSEAGYEIELTNPLQFLHKHYPCRPVFRYIQSHPDLDHMRGLAALEASGIEILNFWDVANTAYQRFRSGNAEASVPRLQRDSTGKYHNKNEEGVSGGNGLHILSPTNDLTRDFDEDGKRNELSYVLKYKTANRTIIFGGDAEQAAWESVYAHLGGKLKCDVLEASHHGRDTGIIRRRLKP